MASAFIIDLAKKADRRGPSSSDPAAGDQGDSPDEGDPVDSGDSRDSMSDEPKDKYSDVTQSALDDIASILNVRGSDREKFDSAMEDLCEACAKRAVDEDMSK